MSRIRGVRGRRSVRRSVVVVSHNQRIGLSTRKLLFRGGQLRSSSAEQGKENKKRKPGSATPPPRPSTLLVLLQGGNRVEIKHRVRTTKITKSTDCQKSIT